MKLTGNGPTRTHADLWALTLDEPPAWRPLAPAGKKKGEKSVWPRDRAHQAAVYDSTSDRMWMLGDMRVYGRTPPELYALVPSDPVRWQLAAQLEALKDRSDLHAHRIVLDAARNRLLVLGPSSSFSPCRSPRRSARRDTRPRRGVRVCQIWRVLTVCQPFSS